MPNYGLSIVEPILVHFTDYPLIIETDLTAKEKADIEGRSQTPSRTPGRIYFPEPIFNAWGYLITMQISLHPISGKYLERLNEPDKIRIKTALAGLEKEPSEGDIKPVVGQPGYFRLKIGGYRALFRYRVTHIEPRGQAYTKKTRNKRG
jgi:mRNA-degrading endonuclease RelE of RelBE toxin-antitoxin system